MTLVMRMVITEVTMNNTPDTVKACALALIQMSNDPAITLIKVRDKMLSEGYTQTDIILATKYIVDSIAEGSLGELSSNE